MPCCKTKATHSRGIQILLDNLLILLIILAVFLGVGLGMGLRGVWSHEELMNIWYLEFPGRLLVSMLKMLILPLIVSSLVVGMASISGTASGKLGFGAVVYYMTTTLIAVIIGIVLVLTIRPGRSGSKEVLTKTGQAPTVSALDSLLDLISQCFPDNLVSATFERRVTRIGERLVLTKNATDNATYNRILDKPSLVPKSGTNVIGVVVFSIALGCVINHLGDDGKPLKKFFASLNAAVMVLIYIIIWYTPVGILFLVAGKFVATKDIGSVLADLGLYMVTVISGLAIHGFIVLPLIFFIATRKNPFSFMLNMSKALFTAWGTASSSATLPVTMDCLINKNKVNVNIVRFVAPVGATINMDGTALYEAVACIYIAQINSIDLSVAEVIIVSLTATAAAIGAAGVPQAGLVTLVIVLTSVGLPADDITFILAIDWFLDRFRTAVNVWGDSVGSGILNHVFRNIIPNMDDPDVQSVEIGNSENNDNLVNIANKYDDRPPSYNGINNDSFVDSYIDTTHM